MPSFPNLVLRPFVEGDLAPLYEIQRDPKGYEMAVMVPRDEEAFVRHWREKILPNTSGVTRIVLLDGEVIGDILSFDQDGRRVIGYWIATKHWGRGVMTAALKEYLALHEKHRPITAFVATTNGGSYRVLEKCGFKQVGDPAPASDHVEEFRMDLLS